MSQPVDAMLQNLLQLVYTVVKNEPQFALDFKGEFDNMKSCLDLMIAFMIDTESLKNKNDFAKAAIIKLTGVVYDADNILTDCIVRDEYEKYRSCFHSSLSDLVFLYKTNSSYVRGFISQDSYPSETIGLEADLTKIKEWILDTQETLLQIAIVGMGGLGKTTIAQKIYHDNELGKKVFGFDSSQLFEELQQVLADKTCLIVMDDVWEMDVEWWTTLCSNFPKRDGKSSCIIITTRNENVANDMGVENSQIHRPDFLNDIDSWSLFSKFAFSSNKGICPNPKFEKIGKDIIKNYDELPSHLKQCLLSFSIYLKDFKGKGLKSAIKMGYEYILQLVKRSLIEAVEQRRYDGRIYECKIRDMVWELIIMNAQKEAFCSFDEIGQQKLTEECRWLGFSNAMRGKPLGNRLNIKALMSQVSNIAKQDLRNFGLLTSLRVLDISNSNLKQINAEELFKWVSSLKRLANLNLAGLQRLESVPSSIRKLSIFSYWSCPLENLPKGLGRLSHLQELSGFVVMSQSKGNSCQLIELGELKQLRVLRINLSDDTEILENELNVLAHLENLKVLAIGAGNYKSNTSEILKKMDRIIPPPALQELYLWNYHRTTLPLWVCPSRLARLQYLSIENGDLIKLTPEIEDDNHHTAWNIEGLCLKYLARLDVNWTDLQKICLYYATWTLVIATN
ncbi:hypothetical protein FEM48_Zijuj01G0080600 [Ziziphus jujuba var. spinosa]|uniref:Disease resistance RPP13-like protein 4 n=1 Tax=Ziziphus jujuba var. spinosa TaxID=714518 RepID=A0A978W032_ZIZJJ|nr:hypothetical protein FEM48_Zijuj01G0080600 [Ziziphus jujuba var. spinosa]